MPTPVMTLLEANDLSGKNLAQIVTHEGSGVGRSGGDLKRLCPKSTILCPTAVRGGSVKSAPPAAGRAGQRTLADAPASADDGELKPAAFMHGRRLRKFFLNPPINNVHTPLKNQQTRKLHTLKLINFPRRHKSGGGCNLCRFCRILPRAPREGAASLVYLFAVHGKNHHERGLLPDFPASFGKTS